MNSKMQIYEENNDESTIAVSLGLVIQLFAIRCGWDINFNTWTVLKMVC